MAISPTDNGLRTTIIHIQDAHCNYAAQKRIAEIIEHLNKEYGIDTVNLEGGAREYDLSIFTNINDNAIREKVSDYFVKEGLVNGAEYYAINNPGKIKLWGIEDTGLYIENLKIYRDSLQTKEVIERHLKSLSHILANLKRDIYSKELLELDAKYRQYKAGNLEFKDYLNYLKTTAKDRLIGIRDLVNIYLLSQTLEQEGKIDFKAANNERDMLINELQRKMSRQSMDELVMKTVEFRTERLSQGDFYKYLASRARSMGIDSGEFPELQKYVVYIAIYDAIDKTRIMEEVEILEGRIKNTLYKNDKEKELDLLSKNLIITKNIFNISLTREDYKYYKDNEASFRMKRFIKFIKQEAPSYNITATLDDNIEDLDRYREKMARFYEYSFKRDRAFIKNIKFSDSLPVNRLTSSPVQNRPTGQPANRPTILITGGFHTENLCEAFKECSISYVSIMPNFKNEPGYESPYNKLLGGVRSKEDMKIAQIFGSHTMALASILNQLGEAAMGKEEYIIARIKLHLAIAGERGYRGIEVIHGTDKRYFDLELNELPSAEGNFELVSFPELAGAISPAPATAPKMAPVTTAQPSPVIAPAKIETDTDFRAKIKRARPETGPPTEALSPVAAISPGLTPAHDEEVIFSHGPFKAFSSSTASTSRRRVYTKDEVTERVLALTGLLIYVASVAPERYRTLFKKLGMDIAFNDIEEVGIHFHDSGLHKDVYKVTMITGQKDEQKEFTFLLAFKTNVGRDAHDQLFEPGELEGQRALLHSGLVPDIYDVFHVTLGKTDIGEPYDLVTDDIETASAAPGGFMSVAIEKFIEGETVKTYEGEGPLSAEVRDMVVRCLVNIFLKRNQVSAKGRLRGPYDYIGRNVIINENADGNRAVLVDYGQEIDYPHIGPYLFGVLNHYGDNRGNVLTTLYNALPAEAADEILETLRSDLIILKSGIEKAPSRGEIETDIDARREYYVNAFNKEIRDPITRGRIQSYLRMLAIYRMRRENVNRIAKSITSFLVNRRGYQVDKNGRVEKRVKTGMEEEEKDKAGLGLCLTPDSLIHLADGTKRELIRLKAGDEVLSLNEETQRLEPHRVVVLLDMGIKPVYRIHTQSGKELKTTLNHPYLTRNGWKRLEKIKTREEIAVVRGSACISPIPDFNTFDKNNFTRNIKRDTMFSNAKTVRAWGKIYQGFGADKGVVQTGVIIQLFIDAFLQFFRERFKIALAARCKLDSVHTRVYAKPNSRWIFSNGMHPFFFASAIDLRNDKIKEGLSGSLDSILSISHPAGLTDLLWYSSVVSLSTSISSILESTSKKAKVSKIKTCGTPFLSTMTPAFESLPSLNTELGLILLNGIRLADFSFAGRNFIQQKFTMPKYSLSRLFVLPDADAAEIVPTLSEPTIIWDRIASIEYLGRRQVYDIEVEGTHNFVAQGIVAHNTYAGLPEAPTGRLDAILADLRMQPELRDADENELLKLAQRIHAAQVAAGGAAVIEVMDLSGINIPGLDPSAPRLRSGSNPEHLSKDSAWPEDTNSLTHPSTMLGMSPEQGRRAQGQSRANEVRRGIGKISPRILGMMGMGGARDEPQQKITRGRETVTSAGIKRRDFVKLLVAGLANASSLSALATATASPLPPAGAVTYPTSASLVSAIDYLTGSAYGAIYVDSETGEEFRTAPPLFVERLRSLSNMHENRISQVAKLLEQIIRERGHHNEKHQVPGWMSEAYSADEAQRLYGGLLRETYRNIEMKLISSLGQRSLTDSEIQVLTREGLKTFNTTLRRLSEEWYAEEARYASAREEERTRPQRLREWEQRLEEETASLRHRIGELHSQISGENNFADQITGMQYTLASIELDQLKERLMELEMTQTAVRREIILTEKNVVSTAGGGLKGLCLTPDSLIHLADGAAVPLVQLKPGDEVLSLNERTRRLEPHRVVALLDMGTKPVYRIRTQSGKELKTTLNHPYLTKAGWRRLEEIKVGEQIAAAYLRNEPSQLINSFFNNGTGDKEAAFSGEHNKCLFSSFKRDPALMKGIGNNANSAVHFYHQTLTGISGCQIVGEDDARTRLTGEIKHVSFSCMQSEFLADSFNIRGYPFNRQEFKIFPSADFLNRDFFPEADFSQDAGRSAQGREFFQQGKFSNLIQMDKWAGINYVFWRHYVPILHLAEQSSLAVQLIGPAPGRQGVSPLRARCASSGIGPILNRSTSFLTQSLSLPQSPVPAFPGGAQLFPAISLLWFPASGSPFLKEKFHRQLSGLADQLLLILARLYHILWTASSLLANAEAAEIAGAASGSPILWDRIISIEYLGRRQVYDIEVEGTHNFVAQGIIAHNTYAGVQPSAVPQPAAALPAQPERKFYALSEKVQRDAGQGQTGLIGKRAKAEIVSENRLKITNDEGEIEFVEIGPLQPLDIEGLQKGLNEVPGVGPAHKQFVAQILGILEKTALRKASFLRGDVFDDDDILGAASRKFNLIALHYSISDNPIALLHETMEYLVLKRSIRLRFRGPFVRFLNVIGLYNLLKKRGGLSADLVVEDIRQGVKAARPLILLRIEGEALSIALKNPSQPHYLLRALQRQVFGEKDRELTKKIKERQRARLEENRESFLSFYFNQPLFGSIIAGRILAIVGLPVLAILPPVLGIGKLIDRIDNYRFRRKYINLHRKLSIAITENRSDAEVQGVIEDILGDMYRNADISLSPDIKIDALPEFVKSILAISRAHPKAMQFCLAEGADLRRLVRAEEFKADASRIEKLVDIFESSPDGPEAVRRALRNEADLKDMAFEAAMFKRYGADGVNLARFCAGKVSDRDLKEKLLPVLENQKDVTCAELLGWLERAHQKDADLAALRHLIANLAAPLGARSTILLLRNDVYPQIVSKVAEIVEPAYYKTKAEEARRAVRKKDYSNYELSVIEEEKFLDSLKETERLELALALLGKRDLSQDLAMRAFEQVRRWARQTGDMRGGDPKYSTLIFSQAHLLDADAAFDAWKEGLLYLKEERIHNPNMTAPVYFCEEVVKHIGGSLIARLAADEELLSKAGDGERGAINILLHMQGAAENEAVIARFLNALDNCSQQAALDRRAATGKEAIMLVHFLERLKDAKDAQTKLIIDAVIARRNTLVTELVNLASPRSLDPPERVRHSFDFAEPIKEVIVSIGLPAVPQLIEALRSEANDQSFRAACLEPLAGISANLDTAEKGPIVEALIDELRRSKPKDMVMLVEYLNKSKPAPAGARAVAPLWELMRTSDDTGFCNVVEHTLRQFSPEAIAQGMQINIKLARFLQSHGGFVTFNMLPEFGPRINEIAYNLNRERTLHPVEMRLGEDEKSSLLDLLFSNPERIGHAKEMFDDFFRNGPNQYQISIEELLELLEYFEIQEIKTLIRTVLEDPKTSLDRLMEILKERVEEKLVGAQPADVDFTIRRLTWHLSNIFVLQDRVEQVGQLAEAMAGQGKTTADLKEFLRRIGRANSLAQLRPIAAEYGLSFASVAKFKLESGMLKEREDILIDGIAALDREKKKLRAEIDKLPDLYRHFCYEAKVLPEASRRRVCIAIAARIAGKTPEQLRDVVSAIDVNNAERFGQLTNLSADAFVTRFFFEPDSREVIPAGALSDDALQNCLGSISQLSNKRRQPVFDIFKSLYTKRLSPQKQDGWETILKENGEIRSGLVRLEEGVALPQAPPVQIPHVFFERFLRINPTREALAAFRQLINAINEAKLEGFADLKNRLHDSTAGFSTLSYLVNGEEQLGRLFSNLVAALVSRHGAPQTANAKPFYEDLVLRLEQYKKTIEICQNADRNAYPIELNEKLKGLSSGALEALLREKIDESSINGLLDLTANMDAVNLIAAFNQRIPQVVNAAPGALEKLQSYARDPHSRFRFRDQFRKNLYENISEYLRLINDKEVYEAMWQALMAEIDGRFHAERYESPDYLATLDEIAEIEMNGLLETGLSKDEVVELQNVPGQTLFEKAANVDAQALNSALRDKIESLRGKVKERISKIRNWEKSLSFTLGDEAKGETAEFADDFYTLFNIGNSSHFPACQSVSYPNDLKRGLTGYVTHGTNKAVVLLDDKREAIVRRIVKLRIAVDEKGRGKPVILVEESTQYGRRELEKLYAILEMMSNMTGLPISIHIVSTPAHPPSPAVENLGSEQNYDIVSFRGRQGFDYSDWYGPAHPDKVNAGLFNQKDARVVVYTRVLKDRSTVREVPISQENPEAIAQRTGLSRIAAPAKALDLAPAPTAAEPKVEFAGLAMSENEAAAAAADKPEARQAATVRALQAVEGKDSVVKIVVGVPAGPEFESICDDASLNNISRGLARNGYGIVETEADGLRSVQRDNRQIFKFTIDPAQKAAATLEAVRNAVSDAKTQIAKDMAAGAKAGYVGVFAPQMVTDLKLAEEYKAEGNIIVVPDQYSDLNPEQKQLPDICGRNAIARLMVRCRQVEADGNVADIDRAIKALTDYLADISSNENLTKVKDLNMLLEELYRQRGLRIKPVDYNGDMMRWRQMQEATATSA